LRRFFIIWLLVILYIDANVLIPKNKCAVIVSVTSNKQDALREIDNLSNKRYVNLYKTYNDNYAVSIGFLKKYNSNNIMNAWKRKGKISYNSKCLGAENFKEEIYLENLVTEQANSKFYGNQPSFDCSYANGYVENKICSDTVLIGLDKINAYLYITLKKSFENYKDIELLSRHEKSFVRYRNNCDNYSCIRNSYLKNIDFLKNKLRDQNHHYMSNDDIYFSSKKLDSYKETDEDKVQYRAYKRETSDCKLKAYAVCAAFQYGCSKASENLDEDKKYLVAQGCAYLKSKKFNKQYTADKMLFTAFSTATSNAYEKHKDDGWGLILGIINISNKIISYQSCVQDATEYYCH